MKQVIFVNAGGYRSLSAQAGSYDNMISSLKDGLEVMGHKVSVVNSLAEATAKAVDQEVDYAIFVTTGMLETARKFKAQYPELNVIVLVGEYPKDEVLVMGKMNLSARALSLIILRW